MVSVLFFCEREEGAESDEEEPLDRRIFEDIIREAGDLQREEKENEDAEGQLERAAWPTAEIIFEQQKENAGEV